MRFVLKYRRSNGLLVNKRDWKDSDWKKVSVAWSLSLKSRSIYDLWRRWAYFSSEIIDQTGLEDVKTGEWKLWLKGKEQKRLSRRKCKVVKGSGKTDYIHFTYRWKFPRANLSASNLERRIDSEIVKFGWILRIYVKSVLLFPLSVSVAEREQDAFLFP